MGNLNLLIQTLADSLPLRYPQVTENLILLAVAGRSARSGN
ncbi:MAG: hypothetical protein RMZ43_015550 [Nostoc sp. CmiVER01]|nr:hypothetical protein [Nostoc sp. CmiVER01]MDZ8122767.1 hypothetical protein [Nostoc sp. CmiVER01]